MEPVRLTHAQWKEVTYMGLESLGFFLDAVGALWGSYREARPTAIWKESALVFGEGMAKKGKMEAGPGEAAEMPLMGS